MRAVIALFLAVSLSSVASPAQAQGDWEVTPESEAALARGLEWLAANQGPEGNWGSNDLGLVAMGALAFLADGHMPGRGKYGENVDAALNYIMANAQPNGLLNIAGQQRDMYNHGLATFVLGQAYGMGSDGGLARYMVAPAVGAVAIPETVDFAAAAIITDGVSTPLHALRSRGALRAGEAVAVVGCGGLGAHAILLARMMGAGFIAAIDTQPLARARALAFGADLALDPVEQPNPGRAIRAELGRGVDLALEFVGRPETVETTLRCLDTGGRAVLVGVGPGRPSLPSLLAFVGREQAVIGSFGMDKRDIADLLQLVARGRLDLSRSVTRRFALSETNEALALLAKKDTGVVRFVVEPGR